MTLTPKTPKTPRSQTCTATTQTRSVIGEADRLLAEERERVFVDLPQKLLNSALGWYAPTATQEQRAELTIAMVQLVACGLLAFSLAINLSVGCTVSVAWGLTSAQTGLSPLADTAQWSRFLTTHGKIRLALDPLLLPPRVILGFLLTRRYRRLVLGIQHKLTRVALLSEQRQPVLSRAVPLAAAWLLINGLAAGTLTWCAVCASTLITRVPLGLRGAVRVITDAAMSS